MSFRFIVNLLPGCKTFSTSRFALQDLKFDYFTKINVGSGTDSNYKDRVFA